MKLTGLCLATITFFVIGGCSSPPVKSNYQVQETGSAPRSYRPLSVRNSCFVEAIHFCDFYAARQVGGLESWAKVLEWGSLKKDSTIRGGHAVAIYQLRDKLWVYDINSGFHSLSPAATKKQDLQLITPQIFLRYPELKPINVNYMDERSQLPEKNAPVYIVRAATTQELHDALKVAVELGRFRPVRVVEFIAPVDSYLRPCAATIFKYGEKLCLYSPLAGTRALPAPPEGIDNLVVAQALVLSAYPDAKDVKWFQPAKAVVIR